MTFASASAVLASIGPLARTADLRARGVTKHEIARATSTGEIVRVRQGLYGRGDASADGVHAALHGGAPACWRAARLLGLWTLPAGGTAAALHVWMGHAGERRACDDPRCADRVVHHWDAGDVVLGDPPPVRNVLLQLALCAGEEAFFVALESALRHHRLRSDALIWLGERLPRHLRWLLGFARSDADSGLESLIRLRLHHLGITVRTQVSIDGVGEVDFLVGARLIIEADGRENHDDAGGSLRHKDLVRDARAAALGYETLRFSYALIVHDWPTVAAAIIAKVTSGAHLAD